ncbi:hypothetical protein H072_9842 [Dactylellina haptotyla CBS 200.50]|uniref:Uncharacterized protein n=1 Tax=Dactylellina haptotyla (strain CBS 200.50) TaxID=1284197 RepID=S8A1H4_DACHA|nr:hypothetical protein H072_9842 [Dactylellina haptotyla CBS 200.50]
MGAVILGLGFVVLNLSANLEHRERMPEPGRFYPSRWWSKEVKEYEAAQKAKESSS